MRSPGSAFVALTSTAILAAGLMLAPAASAQPAPFLGAAGNGVVRALIIGIDQYEFTKPLKGAVADAQDFETTLQKLGVRDLTVLVNNAANRKSMLAAMERLNSISHAGDLIVLTLAGHGAREPERVKGSNADGFDKSFLFGGFHPRTGPGTAERILSTEIKAWLYRLEKRGIDVLFIADTCYGGGLVRYVDPRADEITYRNGVGDALQLLQDQLKPISTTADAFRQQADFERVTFLAAADEQTLAPEVPIPGISGRRGALSYATARAIEGTSDRDRSGVITRRKLFEYSRQVVDQFSDNRQAIWTEPTTTKAKLDFAVFRVDPKAVVPPPPPPPSRTPIRIRIVNGTGKVLSGIEPLQVPFRIVEMGERADLIWDAERREVVSPLGDVIAAGIEPHFLPGVVDRTDAVMRIAKLAESRPQSIEVQPNNAQHRDGERVQFHIKDVDQKYLILFNVSGEGTVQHLFPKPYDAARLAGQKFELPLDVRKPFGADHMVAIVSDARLKDIEQALVQVDGRRAAGYIPGILQPLQSTDRNVRVGTAGLFTAP
jgi:hypothetical protein